MTAPVATGLALYSQTAQAAADVVITRYSTSFALACRLLGPRVRPQVRSIYALVRVADEIVDGPGQEAGLDGPMLAGALDRLEREVEDAVAHGFSGNLVVHAFAQTARECGIGDALIRPFFDSMRADLTATAHDAASHDSYVYGSAEVVGLMCLQVFVNAGHSHPVQPAPHIVHGARRLGAAFQDVNFLRDLGDDRERLGRDYLSLDADAGADARAAVLDRIDADLDSAASVIGELPSDCRRAVTAAHDLFRALADRLRTDDGATRVRVPGGRKAVLAARAWVGLPPRTASA